jgi:hypothetical protein
MTFQFFLACGANISPSAEFTRSRRSNKQDIHSGRHPGRQAAGCHIQCPRKGTNPKTNQPTTGRLQAAIYNAHVKGRSQKPTNQPLLDSQTLPPSTSFHLLSPTPGFPYRTYDPLRYAQVREQNMGWIVAQGARKSREKSI